MNTADERDQFNLQPLIDPKTVADWNEHEHVSEQIQMGAQKLVEQAGSVEIAKNALDALEKNQADKKVEDSGAATERINQQMLRVLEAFELQMITPLIPGELIEWMAATTLACEAIREPLTNCRQVVHQDLLGMIVDEDPEMSSRVEKLEATDNEIESQFCDVVAKLRTLSDLAQSEASNESKIAKPLEDVIREGLAFVINARTQEAAIATWFNEAFHRDRGVVD